MNPTRTIETQCSHAEYLRELPNSCGKRPYEIVGNQVVVHDGDKQVRITISDEHIRHLGSLDLPMEKLSFEFEEFTEDQADTFMEEYRKHTFRAGGG